MARKHLFTLVVILAAAVFAGALAISNTRALDNSAKATTSADPAISFRLKQLDRFERSLRQQLRAAPAASAPTTTYLPASPTSTSSQSSFDDDHAEYEADGDRDD